MEVELNQYLQSYDVSSFLSALPSSLSSLNLSDRSSLIVNNTKMSPRNGLQAFEHKQNNDDDVFCDSPSSPSTENEHIGKSLCKEIEATFSAGTNCSIENISTNFKSDVVNEVTTENQHSDSSRQSSTSQHSSETTNNSTTEARLNEFEASSDETSLENQRKPVKASCMRQMSLPARASAAAAQLQGRESSRGLTRRRSSVRFADEIGQILSTFVTIPSRFDDTVQKHDNSELNILMKYNNAITQKDAVEHSINSECSDVSIKPRSTFRLCFDLPYKNYDNFLQKLQINSVCLESVKPCNYENNKLSDETNENCDKDAVLCTVTVRNIGPEKQVVARCTYNDWKSFQDIVASYMDDRNGIITTEYDTFRFLIPKPESATSLCSAFTVGLNTEEKIKAAEFAIRYQVGELAYWDNNERRNYRITWS